MSESPTLNILRRNIASLSPSVAHYNLSKLVDCEHKPVFLTTNYDDFVERSLGEGRCIALYRGEDYREAMTYLKNYVGNDSSVPVFKFHGTIHDFESIKTSVLHTLSLEPNKSMFLTSLLKGDLVNGDSTVRIVFIGYSFNDPDINFVLRSVQESRSSLHVYTVNPNQATNPILLGFAESLQQYMNSSISLPFSLFSEEMKSRLLPSE